MLKLPNPALIGMVHLPALPGSAGWTLPMEAIVDRAVADANTLIDAGFDAVMVENFGDAPFPAQRLPAASLAAMAVVADHVGRVVFAAGRSMGINALRNDAEGSLGIAAACSAQFVRINVHTGVAATDQGLISGQAHHTLRLRRELGRPIAVLADVHVKHAQPIDEPDIARAAKDVAYRGLADGLIVSGPATGEPADLQDLNRVRQAVPDRRLLVGSGATVETVGELLRVASGVIVGSGLKQGADPSQPVDAVLAKAFAQAVRPM